MPFPADAPPQDRVDPPGATTDLVEEGLATLPGRARDEIATLVSVELPDGRWLNVTAVPLQTISPESRLIIGAGIAAMALSLFAVWVAGRVARPLKLLSETAPRIGSDEDIPPLREAGPADVVRSANPPSLSRP